MFNIKTLLPVVKSGVGTAVTAIGAHKDTALTIVGVVGLFTSVAMAYKAGPVVKERVEEAEAEKYEKEYDKLMEEETTKIALEDGAIRPSTIHTWAEERMALTWKEKAPIIFETLWPTALSVGLTATCIILSNRISVRRNAALMAAYALSETNLRDLQDKIVEIDGPRKLDKLENAVAEEQVKRDPPPDDQFVINTGYGTTLCQDYYTKRYFYSDAEKIRQGITRLTKKIYSWDEVSQNDWYDELNIPHIPGGYNSIISGDMVEKGNVDGALHDDFTSVLHDDSIPVLVVKLSVDFKPKFV